MVSVFKGFCRVCVEWHLLRLSPSCGVVNWNSQDSTACCRFTPPCGQTGKMHHFRGTKQTLTLKWQTMVFPLLWFISSVWFPLSHTCTHTHNTGNLAFYNCSQNRSWRITILTGEFWLEESEALAFALGFVPAEHMTNETVLHWQFDMNCTELLR